MPLNAAYLAEQQDWRLSVLAGLLCLLSGVSAFSLLSRSHSATRRHRDSWIACAAVALGLGAWSAHVVAQLDFMAFWNLRHDLGQAALTILLAIVIIAIGLGLIRAGFERPTVDRSRQYGSAAIGGAILGSGLAAMHYAGLVALQVPGELVFSTEALFASVVVVVICGIGAALLVRRHDDFAHSLAGAFILGLGLIAMQALTMTTTSLHLDNIVDVGAVTNAATIASTAAASTAVTLSPQDLAASLTLAIALLLILGLAAALVDQHLVAKHKNEAARLRLSETRLRQLTNATFEGVILHRDGWVIDANESICTMLGLDLKEIVGHHVLEMVASSSQAHVKAILGAAPTLETGMVASQSEMSDETTMAKPSEISAADNSVEAQAVEIKLQHADGNIVPVEFYSRRFAGEGEEARLRVLAVRDISERKAAEERIRHLANHDSLTGLPNRTLFQDRLSQAIARSKRGTSSAAVLCLDLDRFKNINDINGHHMGDALLRQVGKRLAGSVRGDDTVARMSGDEFAVIQVGVGHPDGPAILADRLVKVLAQPFEINNQQITIGASIGIALYPGDGANDEELLRAADTALVRAKGAGRGTFRFFEAEMDVRLQERRWLERDLRQALVDRQLTLHYQPSVDCDGGKIFGFEALVRWIHPERGFISPADFIPLAEESGLIVQLGSWVLRQACRDAIAWPGDTVVAINLSPVQFRQSDIAHEILNVLEETGLPPHRLELEITEGVLIEDTERVLAILSELKDAGVRLSLDDFGTGYSSLSYLQRFPFDKIKIDRSFIWEMEKNRDSMAIVRAVIALGRSLRITVTAEGVESHQQLAMLRAEKCDQVQGFLIGRPQPVADATALLANPQSIIGKLHAAE